MTPISEYIIKELNNHNFHYEKYKQIVNQEHNGKREYLINKKRKNDVSYSNINNSN